MNSSDEELAGRRTVSPLNHTSTSSPVLVRNISSNSSASTRDSESSGLPPTPEQESPNLNMSIESNNSIGEGLETDIETETGDNREDNKSLDSSERTFILPNSNEPKQDVPHINKPSDKDNKKEQKEKRKNKKQQKLTFRMDKYNNVNQTRTSISPIVNQDAIQPEKTNNLVLVVDPRKIQRRKKKQRDFKYSINCIQKKKGKKNIKKKVITKQPRLLNTESNPQDVDDSDSTPSENLSSSYQELINGENVSEDGDGDGDEDESETEDEHDKDEEDDKGWSRTNIRIIKYYVSFLSYMSLVYHFYFFKLKKIEGYWSWTVIVVSSLSSAISLFQYEEKNEILDLIVKILITVFSLIVTLISAWVKKQNYVERIAEIGKYSIKISKLKNTVKSILEEPIDTRIKYKDFQQEHKKNIFEYISNRPLISPYEWKETVYIISKYYPELAAYEFPWNKVEGYGENFMETYKKLKYNTCWKRIKNCYYCKSKCICQRPDQDKKEALKILDRDINFYRNLPKYDLDYNPYQITEEYIEGNVYRRTSYSDSEVSDISASYKLKEEYYQRGSDFYNSRRNQEAYYESQHRGNFDIDYSNKPCI